MKKLLAMLLALAMILSVSMLMWGCENDEEPEQSKETEEKKEDTIVGDWKGKMDLTDLLNETMENAMGEEMMEYMEMEDIVFDVTMSFDDDGEMEIAFDGEKAVESICDQMTDGLTRWIEDLIEESGEDYTVDEVAEQVFGMSLDKYVEEGLVESMNVEELVQSGGGEYELDGDKLYIEDDGYFTIDLDGDELKLKEYSEEAEDEQTEMILELLCDTVFVRD